jgi:hypothetical protein
MTIERRFALAIFERALAARADEDFEKAWSECHGVFQSSIQSTR